jgi:hypothetical protein
LEEERRREKKRRKKRRRRIKINCYDDVFILILK